MNTKKTEKKKKSAPSRKGLINLRKKADDGEQYSRQKCFGVEEQEEEENNNNIVLNVIKKRLDIELFVKDLDRSHRIGKSKSKCRPIEVKLIS